MAKVTSKRVVVSKTTLRDVQKRPDDLTAEMMSAKAANQAPNTVYVLPPEKVVGTFTGSDGMSVQTFIENIQAGLKLRKLTGPSAADFIMAHLDGAARREIRHRPNAFQNNPDTLLTILRDTFGERLTLGNVMRDLYNCVQRDGETISEFAFRLMGLAEKLKNLPGGPDPEKTIMEQFCDGLNDGVLRRELKKMAKEEPDVTFFRLRDWAFDMGEDERLHPRRSNGASVYGIEAVEDRVVGTLESLSLAIKGQTEVLDAIRAQQIDFASRLEKVEQKQNKSSSGRRAPRDKSQVKCRRCQEMGHYASECPSPVVVSGN